MMERGRNKLGRVPIIDAVWFNLYFVSSHIDFAYLTFKIQHQNLHSPYSQYITFEVPAVSSKRCILRGKHLRQINALFA
jgi:hypothetical protein